MTSQNTAKTHKRKAPRTAWKPGQSGNPGGRPKSDLDQYIREKTAGGTELADLLLVVARGETVRIEVDGEPAEAVPSFKDRLGAIAELARLGRWPVTPVDLNVSGGLQHDGLKQFSAEDLRGFLKELRATRCPTPKTDGPPVEKDAP